MLKKMLFVLIALIGLSGCIGYNYKWEPSYTDGMEHEKSHFRAWWQDMGSIHKFFDKHLFNLDEDDPTRY